MRTVWLPGLAEAAIRRGFDYAEATPSNERLMSRSRSPAPSAASWATPSISWRTDVQSQGPTWLGEQRDLQSCISAL